MFKDKKEEAEAKRKFELHVRLIAHQEGIPESRARFIAWTEGPTGLEKRLEPMTRK